MAPCGVITVRLSVPPHSKDLYCQLPSHPRVFPISSFDPLLSSLSIPWVPSDLPLLVTTPPASRPSLTASSNTITHTFLFPSQVSSRLKWNKTIASSHKMTRVPWSNESFLAYFSIRNTGVIILTCRSSVLALYSLTRRTYSRDLSDCHVPSLKWHGVLYIQAMLGLPHRDLWFEMFPSTRDIGWTI